MKFNVRKYYHSFIDIEVNALTETEAIDKAEESLYKKNTDDFMDEIMSNTISDPEESDVTELD